MKVAKLRDTARLYSIRRQGSFWTYELDFRGVAAQVDPWTVDSQLMLDKRLSVLILMTICTRNRTQRALRLEPLEERRLLDATPQALPFAQDWNNTNLISMDNDWSAVPGIVGNRGDGLTLTNDVDPQTIAADGSSSPVVVIANQSDPAGLSTGGVAEFDGITDPVVGLQGSGTAAAPFLLLHLNTLGSGGIRVQYDLRDVDGSADNSVQQVALQYRIGSTGNFSNVPAGYVADASSGPNLAALVTHMDVTLPSDANERPLVELRIITSNASGNDEWIGVDNIRIDGSAEVPPLPLMQDWTNTNLITADNDWSGIAGIVGFRGDGLAAIQDTDPQTILADGTNTPVDVIANQNNPGGLSTGGVAEFDGLPNPVVALKGSGTAAAPFLLLLVNTSGTGTIDVAYDVIDLDGSANNAVDQVALQYRVGSSGNFVNLPDGYVGDASQGPNMSGMVVHVDVFLPAAADNRPLVEVRIITSNAAGNDEWIGIDNIAVRGTTNNHAPSFTLGPAQKSDDESGVQSVPNWVTDVSANDPGQGVTISVSVDKPELFLETPVVDEAGTLTYTPAANVRGTAVVTVTVQDAGGTASGGVDTKVQTQSIEIDKPHPWYNAARPLDATDDSHVVAQDALVIINYLNAFGSLPVQLNAAIGQPFGFLDTDHDNQVAPADALTVINAVNAGLGGEGETKGRGDGASELLWLLAMDVAGQPRRRT